METFNMSGSAKRIGNESPQASEKPKNNHLHDVSVKVNIQPKLEPEAFAQTLLGTKKGTFEFEQNDEWKKVIASCMKNENGILKCLQKCQKPDNPEEILIGRYSENQLEKDAKSLRSSKENSQELEGRNSEAGEYSDGVVNPERMIEIVQKELKTLTDMSPSVTALASAFSETLSHYKKCLRCSEKISSSLPRILNRIQKLVEYIKIKRHSTYGRPSDYNYPRLVVGGPISKEPEEIKKSAFSELKSDLLSTKLGKQIELSEIVNAIDIAESKLGVQIALKFKSEVKKKRLFYRADQIFFEIFCKSFPIVHLRESDSASIIQIIKPSPQPQVLWDKRKVISSPKELYYVYHQVFALPSVILISISVIVPVIRIHRIEKTKRTPHSKLIKSCEERILQTKKNLFRVFIPQGKKGSEPRAVRNSCSQKQNPSKKKSFAGRLLPDAPEIDKDLLKKAEEEKMQIHKMKELELEVTQLKDLILEVHKNQMELGKVVVKEGIYSQLIIKLTDPNMLEEESRIVEKLAEVEESGKKNSIENLQTTVDDVKQKCILKNRMIMTLVKCLQNNVYKKWWEEVVNSTFDESKAMEKFNHEKVTELLRQTSLILIKSKESKESLEELKNEEQNSEEEPNMKEVMAADFPKILSYQGEKLTKTKGCMLLPNFEEFLTFLSGMKILAFPLNTNVPENMNSLIRKLESQISLLRMENERLWHEIHELRDLLKGSMKKFSEKRFSSADSEHKLSDKIKTSGRTINLTIQIAPEKDSRNLNDNLYRSTIKNVEIFRDGTFSEVSRNSPAVKYTVTESASYENETDSDKLVQSQRLSDLPAEFKFRSKLEKRRSENDLNYLHDSPPTLFYDCGQESEKLKTLLGERNFIKQQKTSPQKLTMSAPHPSNHDVQQNLKPVLRVPSKYIIPEVIDHRPGTSHRQADFRCLLRSPSRTELTENQSLGMFAAMANERELQTIPEHDHSNSNSSSHLSKEVSQAIQYLRTRVRSIHKDVTVLKSKNDRIDKMLDRLIDDAVDNNKNFEEIGGDLNNLKNRLG